MSDAPKPSRLRLAASWLIVIGAATFAAVFLFGAAWDILHEAWLLDVAREHFCSGYQATLRSVGGACYSCNS